ncbi:uncharacterized protein LOC114301836 [Camellia sinensis]|uniref:uncharacterized protein LOC114301836 n=1 Tax=Camellia sinensis TaxID=4442 RepID=UPI001036ED32|nr:uncharacterized protein LOC114301836 [Camellia sinensis]
MSYIRRKEGINVVVQKETMEQVSENKFPFNAENYKLYEEVGEGVSATVPGLVNVDFADVRAIMENAGSFLMGIGIATGKTRARDAALNAIQSPLLDIGIERATGIVWNIIGGSDLTLYEDDAVKNLTKNRGELTIVRLLQGENVAAVLTYIYDEIQWLLVKDEAAVKLDESPYFFTLHVPLSSLIVSIIASHHWDPVMCISNQI